MLRVTTRSGTLPVRRTGRRSAPTRNTHRANPEFGVESSPEVEVVMRFVWAVPVVMGLAALSSLAGYGRADDEKPDKDGYVPLFGSPAWFIHKGKANTWGTYDDGTIFTRRGGGG